MNLKHDKMEQITQLYNATPEQLIASILLGVSNQIESLKKDFQPKNPTEYLTRNEVVQLLKVDLSTLFNWTKKGKLKSYGLGGRVYYKRQEVDQSIIPLK